MLEGNGIPFSSRLKETLQLIFEDIQQSKARSGSSGSKSNKKGSSHKPPPASGSRKKGQSTPQKELASDKNALLSDFHTKYSSKIEAVADSTSAEDNTDVNSEVGLDSEPFLEYIRVDPSLWSRDQSDDWHMLPPSPMPPLHLPSKLNNT